MTNRLVSALSTLVLAVSLYALPAPVFAADASAVLAACDRTPGCSYAASKDGTIQGCSSQSGVCFNCETDGKRQCTQTRVMGTLGQFYRAPAATATLAY